MYAKYASFASRQILKPFICNAKWLLSRVIYNNLKYNVASDFDIT